MLMSADRAHGTGTPSSNHLENVHWQMLSQRGNGTAAVADMTDPDHGRMTDGTFTTCDPDDPQWHLHANEIDLDYTQNEGHAHGATIYYGSVPFFWLPYAKFSLNEERESGFLTPSAGFSSRKGLALGFPYYFNLAPNYDATLETRFLSKRGVEFEGQFRYLDEKNTAQIDATFIPHDREVPDEIAQYEAQQAAGFNIIPSPIDISDKRYSLRIRDTNKTSLIYED